jgi:hypothetical protein
VIENISRDLHCSYCGNDGLVVVCTRPATVAGEAYEEHGPCQRCERGRLLEFPPEGVKKPRWPEGFWRGRVMDVEPEVHGGWLPRQENARRVRELGARLELGMEQRLVERARRKRAARKERAA